MGAARGKVIFVLDDSPAKAKAYQGVRKSLEGRAMFVATGEDSPLAAFQAECKLYHYYEPRENAAHPVRPRNADWKCPGCTVFDPPRHFSQEAADF